MVKLLMQWDIQPGRESSYLEFVTQTFTPRLGELGLELSDEHIKIVTAKIKALADVRE